MAYNNDQKEYPLPEGSNNSRRRSSQHLPRYFRTQVNNKFLSSTMDQLIQPGVAEKLNGYFGRKQAKGYQQNDFYVGDVSQDREAYQLEPAAVIKDDLDNIEFYGDYNDYINQIANFDSFIKDHSILNRQEYYAWNPHIDWDKFVNFREYYWLPTGPTSVPVAGQTEEVESTYTVSLVDNLENFGFVFTPDGLTQNPELRLYRGIKYRFEINTPGIPLSFKTSRQAGEQFNITGNISEQNVESGVIELQFDENTPDIIYYTSEQDLNAGGVVRVYNIEEASKIDVEKEILGKKTYTTGKGFSLSNGMKLYFQGRVTPEKYASGEWYVEGVGDKINLISETELTAPGTFAQDIDVEFDNQGFDNLPYSEALSYPSKKDYITINRASRDGNLWSKYNRWFHRAVIEESDRINGLIQELNQEARAKRPIIEFEPNIKLFNFGTITKNNIDLVDDFTKDVFSIIEGSPGYNIDNINLTTGMRILFTNDPDPLVKNKIFEVRYINVNGGRQITLTEPEDSSPLENEVVLCVNGDNYTGKILWFNGDEWKLAQEKIDVNQAPLFDIFDCDDYSLADQEIYESSAFTGSKVFSYKIGSGNNDAELGFPLSYRSIENVGDITFDFNLLEDSASFCITGESPTSKTTGSGYLHKFSTRTDFVKESGWTKADTLSFQEVIRQYVVDNTRTVYPIDVYDSSNLLDDLKVKVFVNNTLVFENTDYTFSSNANNQKVIIFNSIQEGDIILIKTRSSAVKNENGIYEIATNLERNPLNNDINEFTLGEVNDHVGTIIEEVENFNGTYPGSSNLRDQGSITKYGRRIVRHSGPLNLALYHLLDEEANLIKSLKYSRREYGKFKRQFLQLAESLSFDGSIKEHVDYILQELNKDKTNTMPFYFSDMCPSGASIENTFVVEDPDNIYFALTSTFDLSVPSSRAVQVYLNGHQLLYNTDYTFNDQGFVVITASKQENDVVTIYEYETTNGSYIPPTPTKLGLYPKYEPMSYVDTTYIEPQTVIQGHDGSIIIAFNDYRDDLLIELERRIFNNIKVEYDKDLFNIHDFIPSENRKTGITVAQINDTMVSDFIQWLQLVDADYTKNDAFERTDAFTFNYAGAKDPSNNVLSGYWRNIYKWAFDTDRPHTHPWEMLGFSIKPNWWDDQYGEAPYTSNNLLLWEDLEKGLIRQPGTTFIVNQDYKRPGLTSHIPVDESGNLLSPINSNYIGEYNSITIDSNFVFGDNGPVETAWRKSSEYPFSLLTSLFINQPCAVISTAFDRIRQRRGKVGDIIYNSPNRHIRLSDIVFPNTYKDEVRVYTSGLVNYVAEYITSSVTITYDYYKEQLQSIGNQIGFKIGGFTSKDKFKLILDSKTPLNQGNVFVPEENYQIFANTSSPIKNIYYSGVIIEKQSNGYVVRGYSLQQPYFNITPAYALESDPLVNVGGISKNFAIWDSEQTYTIGNIVEFEGSYYRVTESHESTSSFESEKFAKLPALPIEGGKDAFFRRQFKNVEERIPYGTIYNTIQEVVDFLLGYGNYLEKQGFVFDYYNANEQFVADWKTSAREFMFWTTQNWDVGAVIALSPGAEQIKFISNYAVVDDIYDTLYGYSLLKADGKKLKTENASLTREEPNEFIVRPKATEDGIFAVRLSLVQKEHVVIIDNVTEFSDIIYDQEPGYRQERIKVLGYRTADWDGSLNIPGFIFDNAKVTNWTPWQDYTIGDLVKYKEFYYSASNKISGSSVFDSSQWVRLSEKPQMGLIPNFEYKTNQFADFYDLDTDNFDVEQQRFAQHLIGYQNRDYLANIINDDVSQYKFYQGYIQEKGTKNALTKLFDVLSSADKDSLEFYEEWAIKSGQYGVVDGFEEVEYLLDESKFKLSPQTFELVDRVGGDETDLVYRILPYETYLKPNNYNHAPFPEKYVYDTYTRNSGYVNVNDVDFSVSDYDGILNLEFNDVNYGNIVWVRNENFEWNVYTHIRTNLNVESILTTDSGADLVLDTTLIDINQGDVIGLHYTNNLDGFYKVKNIFNNVISVETADTIDEESNLKSTISKFVSVRVQNTDDANNLLQAINEEITKLWIDAQDNGQWAVFERTNRYNNHQVLDNPESGTYHNFGVSIDANERNTVLVIGSPDNGDGKVFVYVRSSESANYQLVQILEGDDTIADSEQRFGASVAVSSDGQFIAVGSPNASNVKTNYQGNYVESQDYTSDSIVLYQDSLWKALIDIQGSEEAIQFGSYESVPQILQSLGLTDVDDEYVPVILTGNYPFTALASVDHFIVKAPKDMYEGSGIGDTLHLKWNTLTNANQDQTTLVEREPFDGESTVITSQFLTGTHTIVEKIDSILYIENSNTPPLIGQIVETVGGFAEVAYTYLDQGRLTVYTKNQNGTFGLSGSLTTSIGEFVGEYVTAGPAEQVANAEDFWGGYWKIDTASYSVGSTNSDAGRGLVYTDITPVGQTDQDRYYNNILDITPQSAIPSQSNDVINSQLTTLSYKGFPGPAGVSGEFLFPYFTIRAPKSLTDTLTAGVSTVDIFYNNLPNFETGEFKDPETINILEEWISTTHTVFDLWDGYIDITLLNSTVPVPGNRLEPKIGSIVQDNSNLGTAEVAFYQRFDLTNARIYVKNVSGEWAAGSEFNENRQINLLSDDSGDPIYDFAAAFRPLGQIKSRSLGLPESDIGQMLVLDVGQPINVPSEEDDIRVNEDDTIYDGEYWFYREETIDGIPRDPNLPEENNNDWEQVFDIPLSQTSTTSDNYTNEGFYTIYQRLGVGQFVKINSYIVPQREDNLRLGSALKFSKINDLYRLFVKAEGGTSPGSIFVIKNGEENGYGYGWDLGQDKQYKGEFSDQRNYFTGNIVYLDNYLYRALTNIAAGSFVSSDWELIEEPLDYRGFIPNLTDTLVGFDSSTKIDRDLLSVFARDFDVSDNGEVIAVSTVYEGEKSDSIVIYRNDNGLYYRDQEILAPLETINYGVSISLSADGKLLAVGAPFDEDNINDQGKVYVYAQKNGKFELTQELKSFTNDRAEQFGTTVDFDGNNLAIGARNGDSFIDTSFDTYTVPLENYVLDPDSPTQTPTTFDNEFTRFKSFERDTGVVRIYQRIGDTLVYGQSVDYDVDGLFFFGNNLLQRGNHIYVGIPDFNTTNREGILVEYRKNLDTSVWTTLREAKPTVDISKIKRAILYDTKENELLTYLDYIDVLQGKIAGPAEQELTYKTYYDPATYTNGSGVNIDETNSWGPAQKGKLWWDLTNARFENPYQDTVIYSSNSWNRLTSDINSIDVYEWVESIYLPSEWDELTETEQGLARGITGTTRYGDNAYVEKTVYDNATKTFTSYYYYWVIDKTTLPAVSERTLSAQNVAQLIENPSNQGYKYVSLISPTQFALHNCESLIRGKDIAISFQYWTVEDQRTNIHNQYQIITQGLETSRPNRDVEQKWFDSLIGRDSAERIVPAPELSVKEKYGSLNRPRQSWFVNKTEALNQLISRVNNVLKDQLIVDNKNISRLTESETAPSVSSNRYDRTVDAFIDLQFVGVAKAKQAQLTPVIENGKIVRVDITDPGRGYIVAPTISIFGTGTGAEINTEIDAQGRIINVIVLSEGEYYDNNTRLTVRRFTVLVNNDETISGKWALYERDTEALEWIRVGSQSYNVDLYWEYIDWYAAEFNQFTDINYIIDFSYQLENLQSELNDIVKIQNVGSGGWLLLKKIDNQEGVDYTVNYETIGRENGTIQFKESLYNTEDSLVGFDTTNFDVISFDGLPTTETRIILEVLRDNIFVDDLAIEYNNLFFASLRYVFSEQNYVDWAFKTSFIKAKHNVGELEQKINFQNDNLPNYEEYIKEVKPYKTKIREYLSSYDVMDNSSSMTTDFDLPARYTTVDSISPQAVKVSNNVIISQDAELDTYPNKHWLDNAGYKITSIEVADGGSGYVTAPKLIISGGGGTGATATASIGRNGAITSATVKTQGSGYLSAPTIIIDGSVGDDGTPAKLVPIIGDSPVRNMHVVQKFDRVSGVYEFISLETIETFVASGSQTTFNLKWPMNLRPSKIQIFANDTEVLGGNYSYSNILDISKSYDRYYGQVVFNDPPSSGKTIRIEYSKDSSLLKAQDRINLAYNTTLNQDTVSLGQFMTGVDYGGVEVRSLKFGETSGWDSAPWFTASWDIFDVDFEDETFYTDGSTLTFEMSKPLENGVSYNIYLNNIRIDDDNWDGTSSVTNSNAIMAPIVGDGVTTTVTIENEIEYRQLLERLSESGEQNPPVETITIRKYTSDGSFLTDPTLIDATVSGGDLSYSSATGLSAEDINIDGDGFVTITTSSGPEELVPGQVLDTVDITVYEKPQGGSSEIVSRNYIADGVTSTFNIDTRPIKNSNIFVKVNNILQNADNYNVDYANNTITLFTTPDEGQRVNIVNLSESGINIYDIDNFTGNGVSGEFLLSSRFKQGLEALVTVEGVPTDVTIIEADDTYEDPNNCVIKFAEPPRNGAVINIVVAESGVENSKISQVTIDEFTADGSTVEFELSQAPFETGPEHVFTLVMVNNTVLDAGYTETFEVTSAREYQFDLGQVPVASTNAYELQVYLNDRKLTYLQEWTYEGAGSFNPSISAESQPGSTITLSRGIGEEGDILRVHILTDADYLMGYYDSSNDFIETPSTIYLNSAYNENDKIKVYQFSNNLAQEIYRKSLDVADKTGLDPNGENFYNYQLLSKGIIKLDKEAVDAQYVWVVKNGTLLTPSIDYSITPDRLHVKLIELPNENDEIQTIHFANQQRTEKFGWRQFKDMLNRTHYKRLREYHTLAEDLNWYDTSIKVTDASSLPNPQINSKYPGIIFIEGERIEYLQKDGNTLKQLRRGTLGTGVKDIYSAGTQFMDQGVSETLPYKDETQSLTVTASGYNEGSSNYPNSLGISVDSISYNFNNNTAFPVRVEGVYEQICTVTGTGFTDRAIVYVGDVECTTRYISSTQLEFDVPGLPVGAYDLIIVNQFTVVPIETPETSYVEPGAIKYVQILLPYAPTPNPLSATNWYKETIPDEYWEAQDIEVFVGGKRLRKSPTSLYNYTDQDSPEGDITIEAEFAVNKNIGAYVRLTNPPPIGSQVTVLRKTGLTWNEINNDEIKTIAQSNTEVARFLREKTTELPR